MTIDFSAERWQRLKETYARWWAGDLERPIVGVELYGRDPGRPQPDVPLLSQENCTDFSYTPEQLIDRIDWELSTRVYLGDAFPFFNMDCFGPGVAAAFLGARLAIIPAGASGSTRRPTCRSSRFTSLMMRKTPGWSG